MAAIVVLGHSNLEPLPPNEISWHCAPPFVRYFKDILGQIAGELSAVMETVLNTRYNPVRKRAEIYFYEGGRVLGEVEFRPSDKTSIETIVRFLGGPIGTIKDLFRELFGGAITFEGC